MFRVFNSLYELEETIPFKKNSDLDKDSLNILLVCTTTVFGGGETHSISLYKNLCKQGHNPFLLVLKNSPLAKKLVDQNIPHYQCGSFRKRIFKVTVRPGISHVNKICGKHDVDIVHCNTEGEVNTISRGRIKGYGRLVFTRHIPHFLKKKTLRNVDGVVAVSPAIKNYIRHRCKEDGISNRPVESIFPIIDNEKYEKFCTTQSRDSFLKNEFGITIKDIPIICMIAGFYKDIDHKNHPLLLRAIQTLVYKKKIPVQVVLVGDGQRRQEYEKMVSDLKVQDYVHFLGSTNQVPEVLYHSDINILTSKKEGLGISIIEGALMKKPTIVATNTGAADSIIFDQKTGLLFGNDNLVSLVDKITMLLSDKNFASGLGVAAHNLVVEDFSNEVSLKKLKQFYDDVVSTVRVLIVSSEMGWGGREVHTRSLYKNILKSKHHAVILVAKGSCLEKDLSILKLPFYTYSKIPLPFKSVIQPRFASTVYKICEKEKIDIVHCNVEKEVYTVKKAVAKLNVKIVFTQHVPKNKRETLLDCVDGAIGVNPQIVDFLKNKTVNQSVRAKHINYIAPFFEDEKFLITKPTEDKHLFFKNYFGVQIKNVPIVCMVANIFKDPEHKNHKVLFFALKKLIYEMKRPVQLCLVGDAEHAGGIKHMAELKHLVQDLKIQDYVYFLGFTDKVPEILFYSDIKVLASKHEAFGLVLLEAALMKKPTIGATRIIGSKGTGPSHIIVPGKTGLLFKNDDAQDLANQINKMITNPELSRILGENAYKFVMENFSSGVTLSKQLDFYKKVLY